MKKLFNMLSPLGVFFFLAPHPALAQPYDPAPSQLRVMTWNVEWMFDYYRGDNRSELAREQSATSKERWQAKVAGVAQVIAESEPEIVALQEIESDQTLREITRALRSDYQLNYRSAFMQGTDGATEQDVGLLFRYKDTHAGLVSFGRKEQSDVMFASRNFYSLSKHLVAEFRWENVESPLTLLNVHFRARAEKEDLRIRQARLARLWLQSPLNAEQDVILLGDLNTEHFAGKLEGEIAEICGHSGPKMIDLLTRLEDSRNPTHLILDKQFDRIFVSESLMRDDPGQDWSFESIKILQDAIIRGDRDGEEHWNDRLSLDVEQLDLSDHFPVMATFTLK